MKPTPSEHALQWYRQHRRENFAASQRLENIITPVTRANSSQPLPTRNELLDKYMGRRPR